jgi:hypothetical protein
MQDTDNRPRGEAVVAAFEQQTDAERALADLRAAGFRDDRLELFVWHPLAGLKSLSDQGYAFECMLAGGFAGAVLGLWAAPLLHEVASVRTVFGFVELALLCTAGAALVFGVLGWELGAQVRADAEAPAVDPEAGPFVLSADAGEDGELVREIVRRHRGYEPQRARAPHPNAA